jgi:uncharacterized membrane protein
MFSEPLLFFPALAAAIAICAFLFGRLLSTLRLFLVVLGGPIVAFVLVSLVGAVAGERELLGTSPSQLVIFLSGAIIGGGFVALVRREQKK